MKAKKSKKAAVKKTAAKTKQSVVKRSAAKPSASKKTKTVKAGGVATKTDGVVVVSPSNEQPSSVMESSLTGQPRR